MFLVVLPGAGEAIATALADRAREAVDRHRFLTAEDGRLIELPLVLLVEKSSKVRGPEDLWQRDKIEDALISLPANELICKVFQQELSRRGIDWFPSVEVSSLNLVEAYVARGYGIGLSLALPEAKPNPAVRQLLLPDFLLMTIGALWADEPTPLTTAFVEAAQQHVKALSVGK